MATVAPPATVESKRGALILALLVLNEQARTMSRRGPIGTLRPEYDALHARMSVLVARILEMR